MEEKIKLLNEIFRGIDKEMIHMSAQEFAKSDLALKLAETIEPISFNLSHNSWSFSFPFLNSRATVLPSERPTQETSKLCVSLL